MARRLPALVFHLALLVAIGVSTALLIDYLRPLPAFCDTGSGCDQVRASPYGRVLGVPLPLIGLSGFVGLLGLSLVDRGWARRTTRLLALTAAVTGLLLLLTQALVLKVFCKLCVAVDLSAVVAGVAALVSPDLLAAKPNRVLWSAATVLSLLLPSAWSWLQPAPPVPPEIASLWVPGKINVVEFADFQCPFCRQLHPLMTKLLDEYRDRVNFVRLNMPLASHSQSRSAARAYCCAEAQGKASEMADALFQSESLMPEACEQLAGTLGLSLTEYRACVADPKTDARIDDDIRRVKSAGLAGLPTVWVGDQVIVGLVPIETLQSAFTIAAHRGGPGTRLPTAALWSAFAAALAAVGALAMRRRTDEDAR